MVTALCLLLAGIVLVVLGFLVLSGRFDVLGTYHSNADHSKASYQRAIGRWLIFAGVVLAAVGTAGFFVSSVVLLLIMVLGLAIALVPLWFVQNKYNGRMF